MAPASTTRKALQKDAEEVQADGATQLSRDLGGILNDANISDVAFMCKDGIKVYGCRWLLSLRCEFFKGMFSHNMQESSLVEVPLPQFSSSVLLVVFEYLYTGAIESHPPQTWRVGFEIIIAARYFMITALEKIALNFLRNEVEMVKKDAQRNLIEDMLNEALEFQEAREGMDPILMDLVSGLGPSWFQEEDCSQRLSEDSVDYILSKRKSAATIAGQVAGERHTVEEYLTFRQIILWQVRQVLPESMPATQEDLRAALPREEREAELWRKIFSYPLNIDECTWVSSLSASDSHDTVAVLNSRFAIEVRRESLQRLLDHIDWFRIPAVLLLKVVYPLQVLSPRALFTALALQALHKPVTPLAPAKFYWRGHGWATAIGSGDGLESESKDEQRSIWSINSAELPMSRSHGLYMWHIEIAKNDADFIALGVACESDKELDCPWRDEGSMQQTVQTYFATRLLCFQCGQGIAYKGEKLPERPVNWEGWEKFLVEPAKRSTVELTFDPSEKTFRIQFGEFSTVWRDLPNAVYYPYVGFLAAKHAKIRFFSIRGFDYF